MQGFSGKILPAGLEIFSENRRLDLAFPSNPGITFAPRTEMTAWCGSLKDAKMEVNGSGGRLGRKNFRRKSVKKEPRKREKTSPEAWKGQVPTKEVWMFPIRWNLFCRTATVILPDLPAVCDCLFHSWGRLTHSAFTFRLRHKRSSKKKNHLKPRKSTSWHRRKRKRHCNSRHTIAQTSLRIVCQRISRKTN